MRGCDVVVGGPLAGYANGFAEYLAKMGYKDFQAGRLMCLTADLSGWMGGRGFGPADLSGATVGEFFAQRRAAGASWLVTGRAAVPLLAFLGDSGVTPVMSPKLPAGPLEALIGCYQEFLVNQRGLAEATVEHYVTAARMFGGAVGTDGGFGLGSLTAGDVSRFVTRSCAHPVKMSPRELVSALRSFLRFLYLEGVVELPLAQAVPSYASWRAAGLPKALSPAVTARLLAGCDRSSAVGRRDYAILLLLTRLGLRAGEVAALRLGDIDWRAGEFTVRGKGRREQCLPLPCDAGAALADYLRRGRPQVQDRSVFLRAIAPWVALHPGGVTWVVYNACDRAGVTRVGAHCLRHTAATGVLRAGGSLVEVGQLLRHRRVGTTAIYAKVDQAALVALARPWPGDGR